MEIQLSVRRRPLIVPAVEISGLPVYADGSRLMCRDQLSDQALADQHVFILHRTHGIMRSDGAHLACKNIRAVRFFIVLEQVQIKTRISENDRPVKRRASPPKGQICAVPVETEYTLRKSGKHEAGKQSLPAHGNPQLEGIFREKFRRLLIL